MSDTDSAIIRTDATTALDMNWQRVCSTVDLDGRRCIEFSHNHTPGFVFRSGGHLRAYLNRCPHLGIELNWMPGRFFDESDSFIQCATHGALFLPDGGECIAGPCAGDALTALELRERQGGVEVRTRVSPE